MKTICIIKSIFIHSLVVGETPNEYKIHNKKSERRQEVSFHAALTTPQTGNKKSRIEKIRRNTFKENRIVVGGQGEGTKK